MTDIKEYYKSKRVSNSLLSGINVPKNFKNKLESGEQDSTSSLRIGSALDCLLTSPERWEEDFQVIDLEKPQGLMGKFVDKLPPDLHKLSELELYYPAYEASEFKLSLQTVVNKFWSNSDAVGYYRLISSRGSKTILPKEEYQAVIKAKELLLTNEFTYQYFHKLFLHQELMHQVPIYFTYKDTECKALLDGILIDHKNKRIQPFDLKTTGKSVYDFQESYLEFGYYRQCAFYELALKSPESPIRHYLEEGYEITDFLFIVVENKPWSNRPGIIYKTCFEDRLAGLEGGMVGNKHYPGINQLLDAYRWHVTNDYWDLPPDLYFNQGQRNLNVFKS